MRYVHLLQFMILVAMILPSAHSDISELQSSIDSLQAQGVNTQRLEDELQNIILAQTVSDEGIVHNMTIRLEELIRTAKAQNEKILRLENYLEKGEGILDTTNLTIPLNSVKSDFFAGSYESVREQLDGIESHLHDQITNINIAINEELDNITLSNSSELEAIRSKLEAIRSKIERAESQADYALIFDIYQQIADIRITVQGIVDIQDSMNGMMQEGIGVTRINDSYNEISDSFAAGHYSHSASLVKTAHDIIQLARDASSSLDETGNRINAAKANDINVSEAEILLESAHSEFELENFEGSMGLADEAYDLTEQLEEEQLIFGTLSRTQVRASLFEIITKLFFGLLIAAALGIVVGYPAYFYLSYINDKRLLKHLKREDEILLSLMKQIQHDYYIDKIVDKTTYEEEFLNHEQRRNNIHNQIPVVKARIDDSKSRIEMCRTYAKNPKLIINGLKNVFKTGQKQ